MIEMSEVALKVLKEVHPLEAEELRIFFVKQKFKVEVVQIGHFYYPAIEVRRYEEAMRLIWQHKVAGWDHYKLNFIEMGICNSDEFSQALQEKWLKLILE